MAKKAGKPCKAVADAESSVAAGHFIKLGRRYQERRDLIGKYVDKWIPLLDLTNWQNVSVDYVAEHDTKDSNTHGRSTVNWEYKVLHIDFFMPRMVDAEECVIEYIVVHELTHALVNQMRVQGFSERDMPNEERVVTELAQTFLRLNK